MSTTPPTRYPPIIFCRSTKFSPNSTHIISSTRPTNSPSQPPDMLDLADFLIISLSQLFVFIAPYTKVEESFSLQAIHDILFYYQDLASYDHQEFPGVVPRTFIGPLILAGLVKPIQIFHWFNSKFDLQLTARAILALINSWSMISFRKCLISTVKGNSEDDNDSRWIIKWTSGLFFLLQYHLLFYAGRTLPNMMVFPLVLYAFSKTFQGRFGIGKAIAILSLSSVVFRSELAALTASMALVYWISGKISLLRIIINGVSGLLIGGGFSFLIDSVFWGKEIIPEIESFVFNVVDKQADNWGIEPFHAYFTTHLPKLLNNPFLMLLLIGGLVWGPRNNSQRLGYASLLFIIIMSFQPHKEPRFIIYTVPAFIGICSDFLMKLNRKFPIFYVFFIQLVLLTSILAGAVEALKVYSSTYNYPGGVALSEFHKLAFPTGYPSIHNTSRPITVHMDVPVCMTGASRFGQLYDHAAQSLYPDLQPVIYDKEEDENLLAKHWFDYDYLITIADNDVHEITSETGFCWQKISSISQYSGINMRHVINLFYLIKDNPDVAARQLAMADSRMEEIKKMISPVVQIRNGVFIYEKRLEGQCEEEKLRR